MLFPLTSVLAFWWLFNVQWESDKLARGFQLPFGRATQPPGYRGWQGYSGFRTKDLNSSSVSQPISPFRLSADNAYPFVFGIWRQFTRTGTILIGWVTAAMTLSAEWSLQDSVGSAVSADWLRMISYFHVDYDVWWSRRCGPGKTVRLSSLLKPEQTGGGQIWVIVTPIIFSQSQSWLSRFCFLKTHLNKWEYPITVLCLDHHGELLFPSGPTLTHRESTG